MIALLPNSWRRGGADCGHLNTSSLEKREGEKEREGGGERRRMENRESERMEEKKEEWLEFAQN